MAPNQGLLNPYVGPRPFSQDKADRDRFFGRDRETQEIVSLTLSHPVVLVYAPSGAGKTSLFNAKIIPELRDEFRFDVLPEARVRGVVHESVVPRNHYVFNALMGPDEDPESLADKRLKDYLIELRRGDDSEDEPVLRAMIFDQFEEIFEFYPEGWKEQREEFFNQVTEAVEADPLLRIVFVIREDYLARLKPYEALLPERLETRFRLELLGEAQALEAIEKPVQSIQTERKYAPGAAKHLVKRLMKVLTSDKGETIEVEGEYVEPVQLQVVCRTLWTDLDTPQISREDIERYDVNIALAAFYEKSIKTAVDQFRVDERKLRAWFDDKLITPLGTRSTIVMEEKSTGGVPNEVVEFLDKDLHLVRTTPRRGADWVELTHDQFVRPILDSNQKKKLAEKERQQKRERLLGVFLLLLVVIGIAIWRFIIERPGKEAASRQLAVQAAYQLNANNYDLALLLAIEAGRRADTVEAFAVLHQAFAPPGRTLIVLSGHTDTVYRAEWNADESRILTASNDGTARVWDAETGEELVTLSGHKASVLHAEWNADGSRILTASNDGTARVWDAETGAELLTLSGHTDRVRQGAWNADGSRILTASDDSTARVWNAETGAELFTLSGHAGSVLQAQWNADGSRILTGSADDTARVWDAETGAELLTLSGHTDYVLQAECNADESRILTASADGTARVWDAETGAELLTLSGHWNWVNQAEWNADESRILTASNDGTARVWDAETGEELVTLSGHKASVLHAEWNADGSRILTASNDGTARVWDAETGAELLTLSGHTDSVLQAGWNADESRILTASADDTAQVWGAETGAELATLSGHTASVRRAAWNTDGSRILTASDDSTARVWDAQTGAELFTLSGHTAEWNTDESRILTRSEDGTARVWDAETGAELLTLSGHTAVWNATGSRILTASADGTASLWDAETGTELLTLSGHTGWVWQAGWNYDESHILTAGDDGTARVWDAETGAELLTLSGHAGSVLQAVWNADESRILTASDDSTARVWDAETGAELFTLSGHAGSISQAKWNADESHILTASDDGTVRVWDAETGVELATLSGHTAVWNATGSRILTASADGTASLWDAETGTELLTLSGHTDYVWQAEWNADESRILTASADGTASLWDAETGAELATLSGHTASVRQAVWNADESRILTASDDGTVRQYYTRMEGLLEAACQHVPRNMTEAEWRQFMGSEPYDQTCVLALLPTVTPPRTPAPTATPARTPALTATPARAGEARPGANRGEIPAGGGQVWTYDGQAGEVLRIRVDADSPANTASDQERREHELLDTLLRVYTPDGNILAEANDIYPGSTDSQIEALWLRVDGEYSIEVRDWANLTGGAYTLTLPSTMFVYFTLGPYDSPQDPGWQSQYDNLINGLHAKGIQVYGHIGHEAVFESPGNHFRDAGENTAANAWIDQYVENFVTIVEHFGDRVKIFESFYDPNDWHGEDRAWIHPYWFAKMLERIYRAVKLERGFTDVTLVSGPLLAHDIGGTENETSMATGYLSETYQAGKEKHGWEDVRSSYGSYPLDGIGYHLFVRQGPESGPEDIQRAYKKYLDAVSEVIQQQDVADKGIYVSEFGWAVEGYEKDHLVRNIEAGWAMMHRDPRVPLAFLFVPGSLVRPFPLYGWAVVPSVRMDLYAAYQVAQGEKFVKVKALIVEQLGVDEDKVTLEANFREDLEADSLDLAELIMVFEEEFDIEIPDKEAQEITTVGQAVDYLVKHTGE